jgi:hypothetical protein
MRSDLRITLTALAIFLLTLFSRSAQAQDTRAETIAQQQADKEGRMAPPAPNKAERIFVGIKKRFIDEANGLYPVLGSVYAGGGLSVGAGYRHYYGDRSLWSASGMWSIRNYKLAGLSTRSPGHANGRLDLSAGASWMDATQVAYFGVGNVSAQSDRTNYRLKRSRGGVAVNTHPLPLLVLGAESGFEKYETDSGLGQKPSIEEHFTPATAPGLGESPSYVHSTAAAGIDWRPSPGYARSGGLYEVRYHRYRGIDTTQSFDRAEAEIVQHVPILRENWVISLHGLADSTISGSIPYFMLPSLGGASSLRGYPSWRFRERNSLLFQGEFRWIPNRSGMDMAIFYDAGKVTGQRKAFNMTGLHKDVGLEIRFHGPTMTPLRFGLARGSEGWQLVFGGSAAF